ncbi:MAG: hypothetical protein U9R75_02975 [Candidatus Thermoplasmatota archaeon]|nr:hypothetical protein [Candidatus Thermoplasmatota archaeon]
MRIGNVGSISASGELAAFAIAIAVVVSLSLYLTRDSEGEKDRGIGYREIMLISSWDGSDPDGDGDIEVSSSGIIISMTRGPFPLKENIGLRLKWNNSENILLFREGQPLEIGQDYIISSEIHGLSVLVEANRSIHPGTLSLFEWEVVK